MKSALVIWPERFLLPCGLGDSVADFLVQVIHFL